jgi:hypothetical protein
VISACLPMGKASCPEVLGRCHLDLDDVLIDSWRVATDLGGRSPAERSKWAFDREIAPRAEGQMQALGRSQLGRVAIQASISLSSPVFRPSGRKLAVTELRANRAITWSLKPNVARRAS